MGNVNKRFTNATNGSEVDNENNEDVIYLLRMCVNVVREENNNRSLRQNRLRRLAFRRSLNRRQHATQNNNDSSTLFEIDEEGYVLIENFVELLRSLGILHDFVRALWDDTDPHRAFRFFVEDLHAFALNNTQASEGETVLPSFNGPPPASKKAIRRLSVIKKER